MPNILTLILPTGSLKTPARALLYNATSSFVAVIGHRLNILQFYFITARHDPPPCELAEFDPRPRESAHH